MKIPYANSEKKVEIMSTDKATKLKSRRKNKNSKQ